MEEKFKIILFLCNWGPHVAYQTLQELRADIPLEINMVRIPCSGRISKALLFKPFELGADGVILMGCKDGACRYGTGTTAAKENVEDTRQIMELMGLGKERLQLGNFLPDEPEALLAFLKAFSQRIQTLGKSPIVPSARSDVKEGEVEAPEAIVGRHDVFACQDCGKCTSACPLALAGKSYSPRYVATEIIADRADAPQVRDMVNACLTCGTCYERCPSAINFPAFIQEMRAHYHSRTITAEPSHGGFFQSMMRAMTSETLMPKRWEKLSSKIRIQARSKTLFYGGCASYFDIFFRKFIEVNTGRILEDSLKLLNFFDVEPMVLADERCCGHDLLWSGDRANFLRLAKQNARAISESGAEELITACPECAYTLGKTYKDHGIDLPVKIVHMHEYLEQEIGKGAVAFKPLANNVIFQDACRQSRLNDQAGLPRKLLQRLCNNGGNLIDSQAPSECCGNSAWTGCDAFSKAMQIKRLNRAKQSGGNLMITACPKCQIHLQCAMEDVVRGDALKMEMMDLTSAIAQAIYWE